MSFYYNVDGGAEDHFLAEPLTICIEYACLLMSAQGFFLWVLQFPPKFQRCAH